MAPANGVLPVLLVDDSPTFLEVAVRFLRLWPEIAVVGTAAGGAEALEQVVALAPQVVLVDLDMPGMTGLELIPRLRESFPDLIIIVLTLLEGPTYWQAAMAAGADGFVFKSRLTTDLLPTIRQSLQSRRGQSSGLAPAVAEPGAEGVAGGARRIWGCADDRDGLFRTASR